MYNIDASLWLRLLTEWFHILKNIGMACHSQKLHPSLKLTDITYPSCAMWSKIKIRMPSQEFNTEKFTFGMWKGTSFLQPEECYESWEIIFHYIHVYLYSYSKGCVVLLFDCCLCWQVQKPTRKIEKTRIKPFEWYVFSYSHRKTCLCNFFKLIEINNPCKIA